MISPNKEVRLNGSNHRNGALSRALEDGPKTLTELAVATEAPPGTIVIRLDELQRDGYIVRHKP